MSKRSTHSNKKKGLPKGVPWSAGAVFLLGIAIIAGIYWEQNTKVTDLRFHGNSFTADEQLHAVIESPVGLHSDSVDYRGLIEQVHTLPWVRSATISMEARGTMTFRIQEREPIGLIVENEKRAYVDRDGIKLPLVLNQPVDVPLVYGFSAEPVGDTLNTDPFGNVRDFLLAARSNGFGWATLSEVGYNPREGVIAMSHENGVKLLFGHDNYEEKLRYWETFYAEVVRTKGIQQVSEVDLRFRGQVVTRN